VVRPLNEWFFVTEVENPRDFVLRLTFNDGSTQVIDFQPLLHGEVFEPLRDLSEFTKVAVNRESGTIEWPTGADYNPVVLHDWPDYKDAILADLHTRYQVASPA
jgi:hypothetical protein